MNVVSGVRLVAPGREACLWHDRQPCGHHKPEAMEGKEKRHGNTAGDYLKKVMARLEPERDSCGIKCASQEGGGNTASFSTLKPLAL